MNIFKKLVAMCNNLNGESKTKAIKKAQKKTSHRIPKKIAQGLFSKINPAGTKLSRRINRRNKGLSNAPKCYM